MRSFPPIADWYQVGCFNGCNECTGTGKILYPHETDLPEGSTPSEPTNNNPATCSCNRQAESVQGDWTKWKCADCASKASSSVGVVNQIVHVWCCDSTWRSSCKASVMDP